MALSFEQFVEATGAEVVGGNIIVGILADRKIVGTYTDTFNLNEDGQALAAEIEAGGSKKTSRKKAADAEAPAEAPAAE